MTALCSKLTLFKWRYSHRDRPSLLCSVLHSLCIHLFFLSPLIRCYYLASLEQLFLRRYALSIISLRSRLCLCSAKFLYRMGSAYRLQRRTCYTKKEPLRRISEVLKVAATYSPTTQCSTIGDAELNDPVRNGKGWDLSAITT